MGTKQRSRLEENGRATEIRLTADDVHRLDTIALLGAAVGDRYPAAVMQTVND